MSCKLVFLTLVLHVWPGSVLSTREKQGLQFSSHLKKKTLFIWFYFCLDWLDICHGHSCSQVAEGDWFLGDPMTSLLTKASKTQNDLSKCLKIFKSSPETGIKFHLHIHIPNRTRLIDFLRFMWPLLDDNIRPNFQFSVYWPWGTTDTRLEIPTVRPLSRQPSSFKTLKSSSLFLLFCHLLALTQHALPQWSRSCIIECCTST